MVKCQVYGKDIRVLKFDFVNWLGLTGSEGEKNCFEVRLKNREWQGCQKRNASSISCQSHIHTPKKALTQLYNEEHRSKLENQFRDFGKYKKKIQCITANYVCPSKLLDRELSNAFCKCKSL